MNTNTTNTFFQCPPMTILAGIHCLLKWYHGQLIITTFHPESLGSGTLTHSKLISMKVPVSPTKSQIKRFQEAG